MASEYTVIIKSEPFITRFLYAHFEQNQDNPLEFPARNSLNILLEYFLQKQPENTLRQNYGENTLEIVIPHMEYKNVAVYNYLSEKRQKLFLKKVKALLYAMFNVHFTKLRKKMAYTKEETIDYMMEEYGFLPEDYDRLLKEYQRWINTEYSYRYRRKKKLEAAK